MKKIVKSILISVLIIVLVGTSCQLTPIDAKPRDDINGTYTLVEYRYYDPVEVAEYSSLFEYFYIILDSSSYARVAYKIRSEESYVAFVTSYTPKYKRTSTELVQEITVSFVMPFSCYPDSVVYLLTISGPDMLTCHRSKYTFNSEAQEDNRVRRELVYFTLKQVSFDQTFGFAESQIGYKLNDVDNPYLIE